jgi:hypothetical protein
MYWSTVAVSMSSASAMALLGLLALKATWVTTCANRV